MAGKKRRRKSKSAAVYIPIAVLLSFFLMLFGASVFLKIIEIEVIGASKYADEEIIKASGIAIGANMLFVDVIEAEQGIYSTLPYINDIKIEYSPPDKMRINVSETTALATIEYLDAVLMIDSTGKILEQINTEQDELIEIRGFTPASAGLGSLLKADSGDDTRLSYLKEVLVAIEKEGIQEGVSYIDVTNISYISFHYRGRFTVMLGTPDNIRHKLGSLPEIIADIEKRAPKDEEWTIYMRDQWRWSPDR